METPQNAVNRNPRKDPRPGDVFIVFDKDNNCEERTVLEVTEKSIHYRKGNGPGKWMFRGVWQVLVARPSTQVVAVEDFV